MRNRAPRLLSFALLTLAGCASTPAERVAFDLLAGRMVIDSDLGSADAPALVGVELSAPAAFGTFGWEAGLVTGDDDGSIDDPVASGQVEIDVLELYIGARREFRSGPWAAHVGGGLSYLQVDNTSLVSLPGDGVPLDAVRLADEDLGGYLQLGATVDLSSSIHVGLWGRVRSGGDLEAGPTSFESTAGAVGLRLGVSR